MKPLVRARNILKAAEGQLRELLALAAEGGEYGDVVTMAAWARTIGEMVGSDSLQNLVDGSVAIAPRAPHKSATPQTPSKSSGYPRFFRQADRLVRVSWSKNDKKEYEHKAPRSVVLSVVNRIAELAAEGRVFSTDELLPIRADSDEDVPTYQVYAVLALFKQVGLVEQHGRQGYSAPRSSELRASFDSLWDKLPER